MHVICIVFVKRQKGPEMPPPPSCPYLQSRSRNPSPSSIRDPAGAGAPLFSSPGKDDLAHPICKMGHNPGHHHRAVSPLQLVRGAQGKPAQHYPVVGAERWNWGGGHHRAPLSGQAPTCAQSCLWACAGHLCSLEMCGSKAKEQESGLLPCAGVGSPDLRKTARNRYGCLEVPGHQDGT